MARAHVIDLDRCSGCDSCVVSCKFENNISLGNYWNRVVALEPLGEYPDVEMYWLPIACQQCEDAPCIPVCPTGASYRDPDNGVVLIDKDKCIGCQYCVYSCPYGVRMLNKEAGVMEKCTLCDHLTHDSDGNRNIADTFDPAHAVPPCVHNCPCGARFFGDLDDPNSAAAKAIADGEAKGKQIKQLTDKTGAKPLTTYMLSPRIATWREIATEERG